MNYVKDIPYKKDGTYKGIVEIFKGSKNKMELIAPEFDSLELSTKVEFRYPYNYGLIPQTLEDDSDPIDLILWGKRKKPLEVIDLKLLGLIKTIDKKGEDPKVIAVPNTYEVNDQITYKIISEVMLFLNALKRVKYLEIDPTFYNEKVASRLIEDAHINYLQGSKSRKIR